MSEEKDDFQKKIAEEIRKKEMSKLLKFTSFYSNGSEFIAYNQIVHIQPYDNPRRGSKIYMKNGNYTIVSELPEEVAAMVNKLN